MSINKSMCLYCFVQTCGLMICSWNILVFICGENVAGKGKLIKIPLDYKPGVPVRPELDLQLVQI